MPEEPWDLKFFQRHPDDDPEEACPGEDFLDSCPPNVQDDLLAILHAVAIAPPPSFTGGGMWEAMHGEMAGFYEVRTRGPSRRLYRLFCILERAAPGLKRPTIVVVAGLSKLVGSAIRPADYSQIKKLSDEYRSRTPRNVV